jgi:hypothetical protein
MSGECRVPEWEEYPHTPGVFVRVARHGGQANKGLAIYGSWKNVRKMGDEAMETPRGVEERAQCKKRKVFGLKEVPLVFCKCCI